MSCGVRARKALFYKVFAGSYFLSGSVKNRHFERKWCSKWCSEKNPGIEDIINWCSVKSITVTKKFLNLKTFGNKDFLVQEVILIFWFYIYFFYIILVRIFVQNPSLHNFSVVIGGNRGLFGLLLRLFSAFRGIGSFSSSGGVPLPSSTSVSTYFRIFMFFYYVPFAHRCKYFLIETQLKNLIIKGNECKM